MEKKYKQNEVKRGKGSDGKVKESLQKGKERGMEGSKVMRWRE